MKTRALVAIVTIVVVALVVLAGALLVIGPPSATPPVPVASTNVQVDRYPTGSNWSGAWGTDPDAAESPNGTVYVVWLGVRVQAIGDDSGYLPPNATAVWLAWSGNHGANYSTPVRVSPLGETYAFNPVITITPNGTVVVAWLNESSTEGIDTILVASEAVGSSAFYYTTAVEFPGPLDVPWLGSFPDGDVFLTYSDTEDIYWTVSSDGGRTFGPSTPIGGTGYPTDTVTAGASGLWVTGFDLYPSAGLTSIWVASVNVSSGVAYVSTPAYTNLPYPCTPFASKSSCAGATLAVADGTTYLAYTGGNQTSIQLVSTADGGRSWSTPETVFTGPNDTAYVAPILLMSASGAHLALAWQDNSSGSWKEYVAVGTSTTATFGPAISVSDADGLPANVLNEHGCERVAGLCDDLALLSGSGFLVLWSDGRGLPPTAWSSHVYSAQVSVDFE